MIEEDIRLNFAKLVWSIPIVSAITTALVRGATSESGPEYVASDFLFVFIPQIFLVALSRCLQGRSRALIGTSLGVGCLPLIAHFAVQIESYGEWWWVCLLLLPGSIVGVVLPRLLRGSSKMSFLGNSVVGSALVFLVPIVMSVVAILLW